MEAGREVDEPGAQDVEVVQDPLIPLRDVPPNTADTRIFARSEFHQGPIPAPSILAQYGEVDHTFPERIVAMAEKEIDTRSHAITETVDAEAFGVRMGVVSAAVVPILALVLAFVLVLLGHEAAAVVCFVPGLVAGLAQIISAVRGDHPKSGSIGSPTSDELEGD